MTADDLKTKIPLPLEAIAEICRRYQVERLDVFGSVLRDDFHPGSDVDFTVVFRDDDAGPWMGKFLDLQEDLERLLGRKVDIVDRRGIEKSPNYLRRRHILSTSRLIYAEG